MGVSQGRRSPIYRVDPVSGVSNHAWLVDAGSLTRVPALSVAPADNQLLVTKEDNIEQYSISLPFKH